jgi:hypothetical protein
MIFFSWIQDYYILLWFSGNMTKKLCKIRWKKLEGDMKKRFHYIAENKVKILREHLDNQILISELSDRYEVHPTMIYKFEKNFINCKISHL